MEPLRILVVEDERDEFSLIRGQLQSVEACEVDWEPDLDRALNTLESGHHHACLADFKMGKRSGLDFVKAATARGIKQPVVILSGLRDPAVSLHAIECGAADYLIKTSSDEHTILRTLRHAVSRQRALITAIEERTRLATFGAAMGRALTSMGSLEETLRSCSRILAEFLPVQLVQIHLFNAQSGEFRRMAGEGPLSATTPETPPAPVDFINGEKCISCPAVDDHRLGDRSWIMKHEIAAGLSWPLMLEHHLLGLLTIHSSKPFPGPILEELGSVIPALSAFLARFSLESQVRRTQQLDCVGKMAAGIAHEFKNNLAVIQTHVWEAVEALEEAPPSVTRETLNQIVRVTDSATALAQQLMLFARPDDVALRPLDLNAAILDLRPMIRGAVDQRVSLHVSCHAEATTIESNPILLQQVIVNLSCNARDAMPDGGSLWIETWNVHIDAARAATSPEARVGDYLLLTIRDSGTGMTPETKARLFEPFFTTKAPGKGNGLGLATVFNIVRQHEGWLEVQSEVNVGTTFSIYLPISSKPLPPVPALDQKPLDGEKPQGVQANRERVLIVEDEPVLRMAAEVVLRKANFDVTAAADGQEAMKAWREKNGGFDVLLTDLSMPEGMTGLQLATQLLKDNPRIKVILTSGYAPEMFERGLAGQETMFLQKPYPPSALPEKVRSCLGI